MKFLNFLSSAALGAVMVGIGVGGVAAPASAQEKVTWHLSAWGNSREVTHGFEHLAKALAEKTDGNFEIKLHFAETISPAKENLDGIKLGTFEMAMTCTSYHPGKNPMSTVLDLPFLPITSLEIGRDTHEAVYAHPVIQDEMKRWNAIPYASLLMPAYEFMGKGKPPQGLEGWKGLRLRALGGLGQAMTHIGAVPTTLPAPEVYTGLERGMIDGASFAYYAHAAYSLHEISDWYTVGLAPGSPNCPLVVGIDAWNGLPDEYRQLMTELKSEYYDVMISGYREADERLIPMFDKVLTRVTYTPEQRKELAEKASKPVWDAWIAENSSKGPAQELFDFTMAAAEEAGEGS